MKAGDRVIITAPWSQLVGQTAVVVSQEESSVLVVRSMKPSQSGGKQHLQPSEIDQEIRYRFSLDEIRPVPSKKR